MKRIFSLLTTLILIWAVLMFVDYTRVYNNNEEKFLVNIDNEVTKEYTKKIGLGYSATLYNYDIKNVKDGQVIKEFAIFGFVVSKEIVVLNR